MAMGIRTATMAFQGRFGSAVTTVTSAGVVSEFVMILLGSLDRRGADLLEVSSKGSIPLRRRCAFGSGTSDGKVLLQPVLTAIPGGFLLLRSWLLGSAVRPVWATLRPAVAVVGEALRWRTVLHHVTELAPYLQGSVGVLADVDHLAGGVSAG